MKRQGGPSGGKSGGSSRRGLTEDDHAIWENTAQSVKPLRHAPRVHAATERLGARLDGDAPARQHRAHDNVGHHLQPTVTTPVRSGTHVPQLAEFDARKAKKIRAGRLQIERRIDLHGLRQSEAHARLRRFLVDCHHQGVRHVLVITGKGAPRRHHEDREDAEWTTQEPGILRRQVPRWLSEPDLRSIVVSFTTAAVQHGGEGALYVHLRRLDRVV